MSKPLAYVATLNNYSEEDVAILRTPNPKLQYIIVGHEVGENGTPHLQIYFQLHSRTRLNSIKNWGGPWARMHLEAARGTSEEASVYCKKEGAFFEVGERLIMGRAGVRNDINDLKKSIAEGLCFNQIVEKHFEETCKYSSFIKSLIVARDNQVAREDMKVVYEGVVWKPWQQHLINLVKEPADRRKINWVYDEKGNQGKSFLSTFLSLTMNAVVMGQGKKADLALIWAEHPGPTWPVVVFDLSRQVIQQENEKKPISHLRALAEDMKNGRVTSTKYSSAVVYRPPPHVIFFANFPPERELLSADRWSVHHIH